MSIDRSSDVRITGNTITSSSFAPSVSGIIVGSSVAGQHIHGNWIEDNKITLRGPGKGIGIRIMCNAANADCTDNTVVDNDITGGGGTGAYSGISMARYAGTLDKTVVALNRFASIAKPLNPEAGTKPKLLGNRGASPSSEPGTAAQTAAAVQSSPGEGDNDDRSGRLVLSSGRATYQFKNAYSKPPECIAVESASRKRLTAKATTTELTITGSGDGPAVYVCHGD
jgi:hypothetical protein